MIMLRNSYRGENICAFDNETDAFEMMMSLVEEEAYEDFCFWLNAGSSVKVAIEQAMDTVDEFVEGCYFQEFPYISGDFPHLKEDD